VRDFAPAGFFVLRTPLLPFAEFAAWTSGLGAIAALGEPTRLTEALRLDRARLRARLRELMAKPEQREALFLASPRLDESFEVWLREPEGERGHKLELALLRYFARSAGRATPYGLYAGSSVGQMAEETRLALGGRAEYARHTRLGMDYLFRLTESLRHDPEARKCFTYRPNSSLYRAAGRLRYVASHFEGEQRSYHLVMAEDTDYLAATLARAENGEALGVLAAALVGGAVTPEEAEAYLIDLIESQVLMADIALPLTGREPLGPLIEQLRRHPPTVRIAERLSAIEDELSRMDAAGLGLEPARYRSLADLLTDLPAAAELGRLFQVDMLKPVQHATLGKTVAEEMMRGIELLHGIERPYRNAELAKFCTAFAKRYGLREVPLLEALDDQVGIGFDSGREATPLLKGIDFSYPGDGTATWDARERHLLWRLSAALADGAQQIELTADDLRELKVPAPLPLPPGFTAMAAVAAASESEVRLGRFRVILNFVDGPSSGRLLARFGHADERLRQLLEAHVRETSNPESGALPVEIVHLPEGHAGNVLCRPVLHAYEVPYLGCSGAPRDRQLPVTDLTVVVREDRIVLRSRRLQREVVPRMTNAHNFNRSSLGVYRFLCSLEGQGLAQSLYWKWGVLEAAPFLPRVTSGRLVLSPARWRMNPEEIRRFRALSDGALFEAFQAWRRERRLPRWLLVAEGDQTLPVDTDNVASIEMMLQVVGTSTEAVLKELLPPPDELLVRGPEGGFLHELVVPFARRPAGGGPGSSVLDGPGRGVGGDPDPAFARTFPPGSEWLFAKIYTGSTTADALLREVVGPLVKRSLAAGAASQWFYIRYGDPDWHLRLRFRGDPGRLHREVLPDLEASILPLIRDGRVGRLEFGTYEREVERFGGPEGVLLAERIFHADSDATLQLLDLLDPGDEGLGERWRLALCGIDALLSDFGLDLEAKYGLFKILAVSIADKVGGRAPIEGSLSEKFRGERSSLEELLDAAARADGPWAPAFELLLERSRQAIPAAEAFQAAAREGRLTTSLPTIITALVHMHVNRALRAPDYEQETVLYDFLHRLYKSKAARARRR